MSRLTKCVPSFLHEIRDFGRLGPLLGPAPRSDRLSSASQAAKAEADGSPVFESAVTCAVQGWLAVQVQERGGRAPPPPPRGAAGVQPPLPFEQRWVVVLRRPVQPHAHS